jgi:hypothetical protein
LRRSQRHASGVIQNLALLWREIVEPSRLNGLLSRVGWHRAQALNRVPYSLLALRRKAVELRIHGAELLPLRAGQVLPGLHVLQHLLLALRRQAVEVLETPLELLLPLLRQTAEIRIVLKRASLLIERQLTVLI